MADFWKLSSDSAFLEAWELTISGEGLGGSAGGDEGDGEAESQPCSHWATLLGDSLAITSWYLGEAAGVAGNAAVAVAVAPDARVRARSPLILLGATGAGAASTISDIAAEGFYLGAQGEPFRPVSILTSWAVNKGINRAVNRFGGPLGRTIMRGHNRAQSIQGLFSERPTRQACE